MTIDNAANGVIRLTDAGYQIVFIRRLNKPIEKVWAALTVPERVRGLLLERRMAFADSLASAPGARY